LLDIIAISGLPGGEPVGVTLESDAPRQRSSSGGLRYLPESPGYFYQGQRQIPIKDFSINYPVMTWTSIFKIFEYTDLKIL
jgi:hypothetical protein